MTIWVYIRIVFIAFISIPAIWSEKIPLRFCAPIPYTWLIMLVVFGAVAVQFILAAQAYKKSSHAKWKKPSWKENPFDFKQPVQFLHLGAWAFIITSVIYLLILWFNGDENASAPLTMSCFGVGILSGVHSSMIVFRDKYNSD
jgi:hypothetical protein